MVLKPTSAKTWLHLAPAQCAHHGHEIRNLNIFLIFKNCQANKAHGWTKYDYRLNIFRYLGASRLGQNLISLLIRIFQSKALNSLKLFRRARQDRFWCLSQFVPTNNHCLCPAPTPFLDFEHSIKKISALQWLPRQPGL